MRSGEANVLGHDDFEKICAAASVGKASATDLVKLERHVLECSSCWHVYHDHVSIAAHEFAEAAQDPKLSLKEATEYLNSELFMRRWFDRAEREGIAFSEEVRRPSSFLQHAPAPFSPSLLWTQHGLAMAAAVFAVLALSSSYVYWQNRSNGFRPDTASHDTSPTLLVKRTIELEEANQTLKLTIDHLNRELVDAEDQLRTSDSSDQKAILQAHRDFATERDHLQMQSSQLQAQLLEGHRTLAQLQSVVADSQQETEEQRKRAEDLQTNLVVARAELSEISGKVKDESAALDRERRLLAMGRDVTDLMGARSLHILDVVDTDTRGNARPAFGRIFFTEGKSLVFYAYDLNEAKIQKANYQYQVWAKKEGPGQTARRLGVFYSDDKAQNRWVFKCDDANVVKEIDSVFVTLGKPDSNPLHPEGSPLMFAYLHGPPNHP